MSPLHSLLSQSDHTHPSTHNSSTISKRRGSDALSPVTFDVGTPAQPISDHVTSAGGDNDPVTSGGSRDPVGGSRDRMIHRASSLNLTNTPHHMTKCSQAGLYMNTLTQLLVEAKTSVRNDGGGMGRRGVSVASDIGSGVVDKEGVILEPTSVDLVGRCGLLSALSAQGLQQAKLEGVGNFAGNVLILIQAKVPEEEERKEGKGQVSLRVTPPRQPLLMMSKRLIERRNWAK